MKIRFNLRGPSSPVEIKQTMVTKPSIVYQLLLKRPPASKINLRRLEYA